MRASLDRCESIWMRSQVGPLLLRDPTMGPGEGDPKPSGDVGRVRVVVELMEDVCLSRRGDVC